MQTVLLIDDDVELAGMLREYLETEGFDVQVAHDGVAGAELACRQPVEIVVLDVMMPKLNGIETLKMIRQHSNVPIIMLTAKGDNTDRIIGLELGADDYVPKPSSPREIVARIRAILRRVKPMPELEPDDSELADVQITVGALSVRPALRQATWDDQVLNLTSTEFNLLEVLARNAGKVVSKQELSQLALGRPLARFDRSIDVHLSSIRHKLGLLPDGRHCIQTVFRTGYQLLKS